MSEAADAAESAAARIARKQTNKGRAAEELAKSADTLTLPSKMLPMLHLMMTGGCHCRQRRQRLCKSQRRLMMQWIKYMGFGHRLILCKCAEEVFKPMLQKC